MKDARANRSRRHRRAYLSGDRGRERDYAARREIGSSIRRHDAGFGNSSGTASGI